MYKGTTPTFRLTLPDSVDLGDASKVYVTFARKDGRKIFTKTADDLEIETNVIDVYLNQLETLTFPAGAVQLQVNWTYTEADTVKRACSEIATVYCMANLEAGVLA